MQLSKRLLIVVVIEMLLNLTQAASMVPNSESKLMSKMK